MKNSVSSIALAIALLWPAAQAHAQTSAPQAPVAAEARPNVLVWMLDDVGFAQLSSFGGLIETPNIDRVAAMGVRFTNYHTPPICSATRAAFLTGRNPHSVHVGSHAGTARPFPGYDAQIPASAGTIAENLRHAGYVTYALGKWDHLPPSEQSGAGPFGHWPLGQGFDRYYGFLAAETDNWRPVLVEGNQPIATPATPGYHLNEDLADHAISMIASRDARVHSPPFFMYWATGAAHAPHHAPREWIDHYRGRFDIGWDEARARILQAQVAQGLIPASASLAPRPQGMAAWADLSSDQQRLYARQMEVFAASLSYADAEFGRIIAALEARGELDNTIVVITSDNGASAEGAYAGTFINGHVATDAENLPFLERWGGPETYPHYAFGWAVAGNTPFRYYKQTVHEGGTRVPLIISWPRGIAARGELRNQFTYVTDIAPTILEAARAPLARTVNDVTQSSMEGRSLAPALRSATAAALPPRAQYVEMYGNKGLWADGWSIVTSHRTQTWDMTLSTPANEAWELYNLQDDPGQTRDLAAQHPDRVAAMAREFDAQAQAHNVHPIGNISESRPAAGRAMIAEFERRGGVWRYPLPVRRIAMFAAPPILTRSYRMQAALTLNDAGSGPIFVSGGELGGVGLFLRRGKPVFVARAFTGEAVEVAARSPLRRGDHRLELRFERTTQPNRARVTISVDGRVVASDEIPFSPPLSVGESFDIGFDDGGALSPDYATGAAFPGVLSDVVFDFRPMP